MIITISKNNPSFLVFKEVSFVDGFASSVLVGALEYDTAVYKTPDAALKAAQKMKWKLTQDGEFAKVERA